MIETIKEKTLLTISLAMIYCMFLYVSIPKVLEQIHEFFISPKASYIATGTSCVVIFSVFIFFCMVI